MLSYRILVHCLTHSCLSRAILASRPDLGLTFVRRVVDFIAGGKKSASGGGGLSSYKVKVDLGLVSIIMMCTQEHTNNWWANR